MKKLLAGAAIALTTLAGIAQADGHANYPDRPIMLMVSYGAGGATDFQARIVTMTAGNDDALGMPIAIINKPGAGGRVGWNWLASQAEADGYTMGAYNIPHFIAQSVKGGVDYSAASFEPIANWGADPAVFVVAADSEFNSMADVVTWAMAGPLYTSDAADEPPSATLRRLLDTHNNTDALAFLARLLRIILEAGCPAAILRRFRSCLFDTSDSANTYMRINLH